MARNRRAKSAARILALFPRARRAETAAPVRSKAVLEGSYGSAGNLKIGEQGVNGRPLRYYGANATICLPADP